MNITNCAKVLIFPEAFANTTFHGHFENIRDFQLQERAFSKSDAKISIHNCKMDELKRLDASLKEIKFSNTHIGDVNSNAFDVLKIDSIVFENCVINTIQSKALTEKVSFGHNDSIASLYGFGSIYIFMIFFFHSFAVAEQSLCVNRMQYWND